MLDTKTQFIALIRKVVCGIELPESFKISDSNLLYTLAKKHEMAHIVGYLSTRNDLIFDENCLREFQTQYYAIVRRVIVIEQEIKRITDLFEENRIDYVPLKGAIVRRLYPAAWMRFSADVDILVKEDDIVRAEKLLSERLNYVFELRHKYHDNLVSPSTVHVELHFALCDDESPFVTELSDVWKHCRLSDKKKHEYEMDDEFFYMYFMCHAAKHFYKGGCGVRSILDTWILNNRTVFDSKKRTMLLKRVGLETFSTKMEIIAENWFSGAEYKDFDDVETYIVNGGLMGGGQQFVASIAQKSSRKKYLFRRLFPSRKSLQYSYTSLVKHPWLLPFC